MLSDNNEIIEFKNVRALVRKETSDAFVVKEVFSGEYRKLHISQDSVIVDFGLNIGMFTIFALSKGAKMVYSYEPDKENFSYANYNVNLNMLSDRAQLNNLAVVGNDDATRDFSINLKKNKGAHSLISKRGRDTVTVDCVNINKVLSEVKPTIVKMDIEGGEYECIKAIKDFSGINEFILEFHHAHLNDIPEHSKYNEILQLLRKKFKLVEARAETKGAWVCIIYCSNL